MLDIINTDNVYIQNLKKRKSKSKYMKFPYQKYGLYLSNFLEDEQNISLYIKIAKNVPKAILENIVANISEGNKIKSKKKLFFWMLKKSGVNMGMGRIKKNKKSTQTSFILK